MAAIGAVIVVTGILTGTGSAIGQQNAHEHFTYTCLFPSGPRPVGVDITATFPSSGAVGLTIRPASGTITVTIPHTGQRTLTALHAATVGGVAQLHTTVGQNGRSENATWANLAVAPEPVPATGDLVLTTSTSAPAITPRAPGDITFGAGALLLLLSPKQADGTPTSPATIPLDCTLEAGQRARLATVLVPSATVPSGQKSNRALAIQQAPRRSVVALDGPTTTPADCGLVPPAYPDDSLGLGLCGFLAGFANVNKLDEATPIAPDGAFFNAFGPYEVALACKPDTIVASTVPECTAAGGIVHAFQCSFAQFENDGHQAQLPPTRATFLAFGFEPVTATMNLTEARWPKDHLPAPSPLCGKGLFSGFVIDPPPVPLPNPAIAVTADAVNNLSPDGVFTETLNTTLETYLNVRISNATVNGVPLNVGPDCHTSQPVHSLTTADGFVDPDGNTVGYSFVSGGPVTGTLDIPSFTGCGVGENLDPLFDSAVSSNDDFLHLTQGPLCTPSTTIGCPPVIPAPQR